MNLNQLTIIGFIGRNDDIRDLPNGTTLTKSSVATTRSWKDDKGEWKDKTQWHNVLAFGPGFAQMAPRLLKGTHVFVQGELSTRKYDRTIRILDRSANSESDEAAQPARDEDVPL
jgi:single-strand DNA-binding protein